MKTAKRINTEAGVGETEKLPVPKVEKRLYPTVRELFDKEKFEAVEQALIEERKKIGVVIRALEFWGQLNIKGFPLVTAFVEKLERGEEVK